MKAPVCWQLYIYAVRLPMSQSIFFPKLISTVEAEGTEELKHSWQWDAESRGTICKKYTRSLLDAPHWALTNAWTLCITYPRAVGTATTFNRQRENQRNSSSVDFAHPKDRSNYVFDGFGRIRQLILFKARTPLWCLLRCPFFTEVCEVPLQPLYKIIYLPWVQLCSILQTRDLSVLFSFTDFCNNLLS